MTKDDLLALQDFGAVGLGNDPAAFSVSPSTAMAAIQLRQADVANDRYCTAIVLVDTDAAHRARVIDDGGEIVAATSTRYGMTDLPLGIPKPAILRWSPDGGRLAYTKTFADRSEIWIYDRSSRQTRRLLTSAADVLEMAWSHDGRRLLYTSQPGLIAARAAIAAEGEHGYRYDQRFWPLSSDRPMPRSDIPKVDRALDAESGAEFALAPTDETALHTSRIWPSGATATATARGGTRIAWAVPQSTALDAVTEVRVRSQRSGEITCPFASCRDVTGLWWTPDGKRLIFQRRSGVARSLTQFYSWAVGPTPPQRMLETTDALFGCAPSGSDLLCAQETSAHPRTIIALDTRTGKRREIFNPNPAFSSLQLGSIRRLAWTNDYSLDTYADLVLPPGWTPGPRLPLVVVQYETRGFLRGGTGDEYPIQAMAAQGLAVLSFNRPPWYGLSRHPRTDAEFYALNNEDFADRRSNLSSLKTIIERLNREGIIDPDRVAITGQSDGAVTATFALANSSLFSGAILSTCCESEPAQEASGLALDEFYVAMGYPATRAAGPEFWRVNSLVDAPDARKVPILVQAASSEFRMGLATYRDLHRKGWPIQMYVYPDEGHMKLHPAHRSAVYGRNLAWLKEHLQDQ
ncbi:MAG: Atxe2 family lasso peptide isopeptidase [Novosphingobium sp.]